MSEFSYYLEDGIHAITLKIKAAGVVLLDGFSVAAEYHNAGVYSFTTDGLAGDKLISSGHAVDSDLTVSELKSICRQLDLSTSGLKFELLARVQEATGD